ncbi:diacylglycerol kinase [Pacificimonas sp. WHA3]|uniref:Diacylglycerol kinase n=1 Tax=Pacificimonas pallii TaxID=2827236 RepID=A0ABS6SBH5_9SPHN|nr:acylglycerol kinase family protein [Pacificimonas pallii]MBV7255227.1 diacylglycerol kinase [Pacificimonas pallii]
MGTVALLSNPCSTGNRAHLPRVRDFTARSPDIFHYEVNDVSEIRVALKTIARTRPRILVINGGDGTVQATLTEMHHGKPFGDTPPPVAVLPNGKTNLIAADLGSGTDPLKALQRILEIAETGLEDYVTPRKLISLSDGTMNRPVMGMFLGGAGLASSILFCRHKLYPLGLPNWVAHVLTSIMAFGAIFLGLPDRFGPGSGERLSVSVRRAGKLEGKFCLLMVTTLEKVLLNIPGGAANDSRLGLMLIERSRGAILKAAFMALFQRFDRAKFNGLHLDRGDEIRISGSSSDVILDGEHFRAAKGGAIVLTPTKPVNFLKLAA